MTSKPTACETVPSASFLKIWQEFWNANPPPSPDPRQVNPLHALCVSQACEGAPTGRLKSSESSIDKSSLPNLISSTPPPFAAVEPGFIGNLKDKVGGAIYRSEFVIPMIIAAVRYWPITLFLAVGTTAGIVHMVRNRTATPNWSRPLGRGAQGCDYQRWWVFHDPGAPEVTKAYHQWERAIIGWVRQGKIGPRPPDPGHDSDDAGIGDMIENCHTQLMAGRYLRRIK